MATTALEVRDARLSSASQLEAVRALPTNSEAAWPSFTSKLFRASISMRNAMTRSVKSSS